MEDLIQNAHTLFYKRHFLSPSVPSSSVADTASASRYRPWFFHGNPTATQPFPSSPSDTSMDIRLTSPPTSSLSPLLGLPSSRMPTEGWETTTLGLVMPEVRDAQVVKTLEAVDVPPTSTAEWRSRPLPQPEAVTTLQSPTETVQSSTSYIPASSATSLQTRMGRFSS